MEGNNQVGKAFKLPARREEQGRETGAAAGTCIVSRGSSYVTSRRHSHRKLEQKRQVDFDFRQAPTVGTFSSSITHALPFTACSRQNLTWLGGRGSLTRANCTAVRRTASPFGYQRNRYRTERARYRTVTATDREFYSDNGRNCPPCHTR